MRDTFYSFAQSTDHIQPGDIVTVVVDHIMGRTTVRRSIEGDVQDFEIITKSKWRIWSMEHGMWWRPNHGGCTGIKKEAGLYSFDEACSIVENANEHLKNRPNEAMILAV